MKHGLRLFTGYIQTAATGISSLSLPYVADLKVVGRRGPGDHFENQSFQLCKGGKGFDEALGIAYV